MAEARAQALRAVAEAVGRLLDAGGDADDVLRDAVAVVQSGVPGFDWVGITFVEEGSLLLGPWAGAGRTPDAPPPVRVPIRFQGTTVAELGVAGPPEPDAEELAALEQLAGLLAAHCLVGWDTGGVAWDEL